MISIHWLVFATQDLDRNMSTQLQCNNYDKLITFYNQVLIESSHLIRKVQAIGIYASDWLDTLNCVKTIFLN